MRQYHGCGIYQPSGQLALVETSPPSSQALGVEQTGFLVATRDSRPRHSERRRICCQGETQSTGLASSSADSGNAMDEIWTGERRSIRLARKLPLSYVLLSKGRGRAPRGRRTGPPMA